MFCIHLPKINLFTVMIKQLFIVMIKFLYRLSGFDEKETRIKLK